MKDGQLDSLCADITRLLTKLEPAASYPALARVDFGVSSVER